MVTKIDNSQLLAQLRSMAEQVRADASIARPVDGAESAKSGDFSSLLVNSINKVNEASKTSREMAHAFEMGDPNVTLPQVMLAKAKSGIAFEGMVQVRNKMVEAYQEIMRMQV